jgi:hypothetical protein
MQLRIEGSDLPGRRCAGGGDFPGYENVHVGVQRRNRPGELLDLHPGDARSAVWTLDAVLTTGPTGPDVRGPYIQGRPGQRFIYLSWGTVDPDETFTLFRRAKLFFADVEPDIIIAAERSGLLVARLGLTDAKGHPVCARIRPPAVRWSAGCPTPLQPGLGRVP